MSERTAMTEFETELLALEWRKAVAAERAAQAASVAAHAAAARARPLMARIEDALAGVRASFHLGQ